MPDKKEPPNPVSKVPLVKRVTKKMFEDPAISEALLNDEYSRMLTVNNDFEKRNLIRFNFSSMEFKPVTSFDTTTLLIEGSIYYNCGPQGMLERTESSMMEDEEGSNMICDEQPKKIRNHFNFSERGTQTAVPRPRHQIMETKPPDTATFSAYQGLGIIYDSYVHKKVSDPIRFTDKDPHSRVLDPKIKKLLLKAERMIVQNLYNNILEDFKYFEDPSDDYRSGNGYLLPLWKFSSKKTNDLCITSLSWNPEYPDLFAVTFGSVIFTQQSEGAISLYSLKNPSYPYKYYSSECGVMTVDFHWKFSNFMCVGLYDGGISVYDLGSESKKPFRSSRKGAHNTYVSQVQWEKEIKDDVLSFFSVSPDGVIIKWRMEPKQISELVQIRLDTTKDLTDMKLATIASCLTIDFHPTIRNLFLIGTEEGHAYLCNKNYSTEALHKFQAHHRAIYKIMWNPYHSKIFITCSEDWTVKVWELVRNIPKTVFVFELGSQVYDVEWAPFSSTIFAAVTARAEVFVYDLTFDKQLPVCEQVVLQLKKTRAMHLRFNHLHPILIVGDDFGEVCCLKLSPNLRKISRDKKLYVFNDQKARDSFELKKLDDILDSVREEN